MSDWAHTAFVFPGQGSQEVGMGAALAAAYPAAREVFAAADDLLHISLSRLCWEGPEEELNDTFNTQPALYVTGIATLKALEAEIGPVTPAYMVGHSLGELTALTAAGALPFPDGLNLVRERGRLMKKAGEENPGAMAALLGLSTENIAAICAQASAETGRRLVIANDNCPGQIVISGDEEALERGMALASAAGAKRAARLVVSIASHSPLMMPIQESFRQALDRVTFHPPKVPVIGNVQAAPLPDEDSIRQELGTQLTSAVRWTGSIETLRDAGVHCYAEFGPRDVLCGLVKRIDRESSRFALHSVEALRNFVQSLEG